MNVAFCEVLMIQLFHLSCLLSVALGLGLPLSDLHLWLLLRVPSRLNFWVLWILHLSLFRLLRSVESLSVRAFPERTTLHGSTKCKENSSEYRADLHRSLRFLGFLAQARTSVQVLGFVTVVLAFFTRRVGVSVPSFSLGA